MKRSERMEQSRADTVAEENDTACANGGEECQRQQGAGQTECSGGPRVDGSECERDECDGERQRSPTRERVHRAAEPLPQLDGPPPRVAADAVAAIGFTSGSTGTPEANAKTWGSFARSNRQNLDALAGLWPAGEQAHVVATVPPQHMYGMEMSVLLPLLGGTSVHAGRPFFAADIADALAELPGNRVLVTTPVHLRALVESDAPLPPLCAIVTATAPLPPELAAAAEERFGAPVREFFGSTETCIIASRRTAIESAWTPFSGVHVQPRPAIVRPWG